MHIWPRCRRIWHGPQDGAKSQQDILTAFNILIDFEATKYSYSIHIQNVEDIRFDLSEIPNLPHHYYVDITKSCIYYSGFRHFCS